MTVFTSLLGREAAGSAAAGATAGATAGAAPFACCGFPAEVADAADTFSRRMLANSAGGALPSSLTGTDVSAAPRSSAGPYTTLGKIFRSMILLNPRRGTTKTSQGPTRLQLLPLPSASGLPESPVGTSLGCRPSACASLASPLRPPRPRQGASCVHPISLACHPEGPRAQETQAGSSALQPW